MARYEHFVSFGVNKTNVKLLKKFLNKLKRFKQGKINYVLSYTRKASCSFNIDETRVKLYQLLIDVPIGIKPAHIIVMDSPSIIYYTDFTCRKRFWVKISRGIYSDRPTIEEQFLHGI